MQKFFWSFSYTSRMEQVKEGKAKKKDNQLNNTVPKKEINQLVQRIFTKKWDPKAKTKGKKRAYASPHPVPYVIRKDGHYWLNPKVFSWTKKDKDGRPAGYATTVVGANAAMEAAIPRAAVHVLVWRWANGYRAVPEETQVSHLTDQATLLSPTTLIVEEGVLNRSRSACLKYGWHKEKRGDSVRCPHNPVCLSPMSVPTDEDFLRGEPSGVPDL